MGLFARIICAWLFAGLALAFFPIASGSINSTTRSLMSQLLGVSLLIGLPMLVFTIVVALPLSYYLATVRPAWLGTLCATAAFAGAAAILAAMIFPQGWSGAAEAMILFAALLGLCWGLLGFLPVRSAPI